MVSSGQYSHGKRFKDSVHSREMQQSLDFMITVELF